MFLASCTPKEEFLLKATPSISPARLAILPTSNFTNDVAGGFIFEKVMYNSFKNKDLNYSIQDYNETRRLLDEIGITDGGQLKFLQPIELSEVLGVDGLLFVDINELDLRVYPYYHTRSIKATFYLYNFEKLIWVQPIRISTKYFGINSAINTINGVISGNEEQIARGLVNASKDVAVHLGIKYGTIATMEHELVPEMQLLVDRLLHVIPSGSNKNKNYVISSEKEIKLLQEKVSNKQSIVTDEMYIKEKENVKLLEEFIPIMN